MKTLFFVLLGLVSNACTSSEEDLKSEDLPQQVKALKDDESYTVHSLTEVGGDEFRQPYLECAEEVLYGQDIKESWDGAIEIGKCPEQVATKNNNSYKYIAFCDRLKFHVYRSSLDPESSISADTVKKTCSPQLVR